MALEYAESSPRTGSPHSPDEREILRLLGNGGSARGERPDRGEDGADRGETSGLLRAYEEIRAAGKNERPAGDVPDPEMLAGRLLADRIAALDARRQARYAARLLEQETGRPATGGR